MTAPPARGPHTAADSQPDRPGALWRQPNFRNYALGQGISVAGSGVTLVAVPVVAALQLHASTLQVAGLAVAGRLPPLLFTLHAGDRPRDMDRVRKAAGEADVLELVEGLPHGWDSIVFKGYERGVQLSGGQWQKLGTARTRYRQAPFLLVDEPTSALDPHAEIAAFEGLWSLAGEGHAVVLVTHRLAATMYADHIYVLDKGSVVEDGTHEDLMARKGGLYQGMFTAQAAQYGIAPMADPVPRPRGTQPSGHEKAS
ncbi:Vitamin B12 import ATP-binding protein BtuD [Kitasatospora aureofaciens]